MRISCDCDSNCRVYGDCCTGCNDRPAPPADDQIWAVKNRSKCFGEKDGETGSQCWMVANCPDDWADDGVRRMCEDPDRHNMVERTPVAGDNYLHYRNRYCALCNAARGQPWRLALDVEECPVLDVLYSYPNNYDFYNYLDQSKNCTILFEVPDELSCRRCFPGLAEYPSVCDPAPINDNFIPPDFVNIAKQVCPLKEYEPVFVNSSWYLNFYCYLCEDGAAPYLWYMIMEMFDGGANYDPLDYLHPFCANAKCRTDGSTTETGLRCAKNIKFKIYLRNPQKFVPPGGCAQVRKFCILDKNVKTISVAKD